jgi:Na+-driven multidrug efflux pump
MQQPLSGGMRVAVLIVLITFVYLFCVTFLPMPLAGAEHSKTIVGFLLGTVVASILNYYWGNSSKRNHPIVEAKNEAADLESERSD